MAYEKRGYRTKLTLDQVADLIERRERGWSYKALAARFGVSAGAIHYQCLKHGAISPRQRITQTPDTPHSFVAGDGRTQRRFTREEDDRLLQLEAEGLRYHVIAHTIGRSYTSVRIRLMTLALRDELSERQQAAADRADLEPFATPERI